MWRRAIPMAASIVLTASPACADAQSAEAEIRAEKIVKDMLYQPGQVVEWQIGVLPDGSDRYGLAEYVCMILADHEVVNDWTEVRIVDIVRMANGEGFRDASLGRVNCASGRREKP